MKVIIAGSRPPEDIRRNHTKLREWYTEHRGVVAEAVKSSKFLIDEVVTGKAKGFDFLGESWATDARLPIAEFPADWAKYAKRAGLIRNMAMAEYADALIAITYGTGGTAHMISAMKELGKPVYVLDLRPRKAVVTLPSRSGIARTHEGARP